MTPEQISLVQKSFAQVPQLPAAALFYDRLFSLDPALRPLFKSDLENQGGRFMSMIAAVVQGLGSLESLLPAIRDLGVRHVDYGVRPEHYKTAGEALLWTIEQALGEGYRDDLKVAWEAFIELLFSTMMEAAYGDAA